MSNHKEAFCLMWYACKCGHRERIWNSRDGVTPFGVNCRSCRDIMSHVDWNNDRPAPDYQCVTGQRFFRDGTAEDAERILRRRAKSFAAAGYAIPDDDLEKMISEAQGTSGEFQQGWPMLDTFAAPLTVALPDHQFRRRKGNP